MKLSSVQEVAEGFAENAAPFFQRVQLLCILPRLSQEASDTDIGRARLVAQAMAAADGQRHLAGVLGSARAGGQQQGPGGDRLAMMFGVGQGGKQAPPVVDQRHRACEQLAARQILYREAPQPHWFFSSSKTFSQSARSRYNCPSVWISLSSEVTTAAYSQTARDGRGDQLDAEQVGHQCRETPLGQQLIAQQVQHERSNPFAVLHRGGHPCGERPPVCVPQAAQRQPCARCSVTTSGLGSGRSNTCRATWPFAIAAVKGSPHAAQSFG